MFFTVDRFWQLLSCLSVVGYLFASIRVIDRFYRRGPLIGLDRSRTRLGWQVRLIKAQGLVWVSWFPLTAVQSWRHNLPFWSTPDLYWYVLLSLFAVFMAVFGYHKLRYSPLMAHSTYLKPPSAREWKVKAAVLQRAMIEHQYYKDPELSVASLAKNLNLTPHELSRVLNLGINKNFSDFVNAYRIREVRRKLVDPANERLTLLGIAYDSGFNSKTTFNRIFREMTGLRPAEYKNKRKK